MKVVPIYGLLFGILECWVILHPLTVVYKQVMRYFYLLHELPHSNAKINNFY